MQIIHKIDNFVFTIFHDIKNRDKQSLINEIQVHYTYWTYKPKGLFEANRGKIYIHTPSIISQDGAYKKEIAFSEKGKYSEVKPILKHLISKNPTVSEYHRKMEQILSDEGAQEETNYCLKDDLLSASKIGWALRMMGIIFAKLKDEMPTIIKYYVHILIANPNDNITINNIATNLMQQGKLEESKKYFWEALRINDKYPITHFAL